LLSPASFLADVSSLCIGIVELDCRKEQHAVLKNDTQPPALRESNETVHKTVARADRVTD
jgi:hypothetical protein